MVGVNIIAAENDAEACGRESDSSLIMPVKWAPSCRPTSTRNFRTTSPFRAALPTGFSQRSRSARRAASFLTSTSSASPAVAATTRPAPWICGARPAGRGSPYLLVVGVSRSGKSSLARAGLVPRLTTPGVIKDVGVAATSLDNLEFIHSVVLTVRPRGIYARGIIMSEQIKSQTISRRRLFWLAATAVVLGAPTSLIATSNASAQQAADQAPAAAEQTPPKKKKKKKRLHQPPAPLQRPLRKRRRRNQNNNSANRPKLELKLCALSHASAVARHFDPITSDACLAKGQQFVRLRYNDGGRLALLSLLNARK